MSFRFDRLKQLGDRVNVTIPVDEDGYMGRECPAAECEGYFKVKPGTGLRGIETCICPYCGLKDSSNRFYTKAQVEYAKSIVLGKVVDALRHDLKKLEFDHKPQGAFGIGLSLKVKHGPPVPIRHYREERLETAVACASCTLQYSVFGVFAYCPDCGVHNSLQILDRNLDLVSRQLQLAAGIPDPDLQLHLIEDALENCVSAFDGFGREACRVRASRSNDPAKAESMSFQNLGGAAKRLLSIFNFDFRASMAPDKWQRVTTLFQRRHLIAHKAGVIDEQYLLETGEPSHLLGKRVRVSADDVTECASLVRELGSQLLGLLP